MKGRCSVCRAETRLDCGRGRRQSPNACHSRLHDFHPKILRTLNILPVLGCSALDVGYDSLRINPVPLCLPSWKLVRWLAANGLKGSEALGKSPKRDDGRRVVSMDALGSASLLEVLGRSEPIRDRSGTAFSGSEAYAESAGGDPPVVSSW